MSTPLKYKNSILGTHRGNKRVWIEKARLNETDFEIGKHIDVDIKRHKMIITVSESGERIVSKRRGDPVIDVNSQKVSEAFDGIDEITMRIERDRIIITPLKEEMEQKKALRKIGKKRPTFVDLFAGSGLLSEAMKQAGAIPVAAVEIDGRYLENYEKNHPQALTFQTPIEKLDMSLLPSADVVLGGVPCENYSLSGISKQQSCGLKSKEAGSTGSVAFFLLQAVAQIRPHTVVIEEVLGFGKSAMADIVRSVLSAYGYSHQHESILNGKDYGSMTTRKRFCLVATMKEGFQFRLPQPSLFRKQFGDILEIPVEEREWLTEENSATIKTYYRRMREHKAKGNGFRMMVFGISDELTGTFTKGFYKRRITDPLLKHPSVEGAYSFLTPRELARVHGLSDSFILPPSKTVAGEIIGQGVDTVVFGQVARDVMALVA